MRRPGPAFRLGAAAAPEGRSPRGGAVAGGRLSSRADIGLRVLAQLRHAHDEQPGRALPSANETRRRVIRARRPLSTIEHPCSINRAPRGGMA
jgi:hypothetical protein